MPKWLELHGEQRIRFESVNHRYRAGEVAGDELFAFRTRAQARVTTRHFIGIAEAQDSRVGMTDSGTTINPRQVFGTKMSQLSGGVRWRDLGPAKLGVQVEVGRFSRDYGTGRLISRLIYANTSNIQDGVVAGVSGKGWSVQGLALRPAIYTYPSLDVDARYRGARFGGVYATSTRWAHANLDGYVLHLNDGSNFPAATRRRLETPGFRTFGTLGKKKHVEYEVEAAGQWGEVGPLVHRAWFEHVQAGYGWPDVRFSPRVLGLYDYASGDKDPTDSRSGAFDTLYGRIRFEFGPTSMYGLLGRSNLNSPGIWVFTKPTKAAELSVQQRWVDLAQARNGWRQVGIASPTGQAGTDLGSQTEVRLRYRWRRYFEFDGGVVHFNEGAFVRALKPMPGGSTTFYFAGTEWRF